MKYLIAFWFGIILFTPLCAQVGIGTVAPDPSAQLEIAAGNKGVLIPRVSKINRPANPATGLMIYQTDNLPGFYFYTGTVWKKLYSVADADTMVTNPNPGEATDPGPAAGATGTITGADAIVYTTVRLGDGSVWLQQNLGASRVATAVDDVQSYGDLYQWGRWTDGHEKRSPVFSRTITAAEPNPNNPNGLIKQWGSNINPFYYDNTVNWWPASRVFTTDSWTAATASSVDSMNGCDPCKLLLGSTWRLPTRAEYLGITDNASVTGTAITNGETAFAGYLKMSWAGRRDANSTSLYEVGSYGYFWASTAIAGGSGIAQSNRFSFRGNAGVYTVNTGGAYRGFGYSIRCKKD